MPRVPRLYKGDNAALPYWVILKKKSIIDCEMLNHYSDEGHISTYIVQLVENIPLNSFSPKGKCISCKIKIFHGKLSILLKWKMFHFEWG